MLPDVVEAAQRVLDDWQQDEEGYDEEFGNGGACDAVSRAMAHVLSGISDVAITDGGQDGDDHAFLLIYDDVDAFAVDIPANVYETGGGYSWRKREGIQLSEDDVVIDRIRRSDIVVEDDFEMNRNAARRGGRDLVTRYLGICGVCEGEFKLTSREADPSPMSDSFRLVHHGYKRPGHGHIVGDCLAVGMAPYQVSLDATHKYLLIVEHRERDTRSYLERLEGGHVRSFEKMENSYEVKYRGAQPIYRTVTEVDGWDFKDILRSKINFAKGELNYLEREIGRMNNLIHNWARRPVRTIDESLAEKRAGVDARKAERDAARAVKQAKRSKIEETNARREGERQELLREYRSIFRELAEDPTPANKRRALEHWNKLNKRTNAKTYLRFKYPNYVGELGVDSELMALDLAAERDGRMRYADSYGRV